MKLFQIFFFKWVFVGRKHLFVIEQLFYFKLFETVNTVLEEKSSTQLKSWKAPFSFLCKMQIFKILFNKNQFYFWTDITEICHLNLRLWSFQLILCICHKEPLSPSHHHKSVWWKISPCYLKSTLLSSDNYVWQSFLCRKFELRLLELVLLFANSLILLDYFILLWSKIHLSSR